MRRFSAVCVDRLYFVWVAFIKPQVRNTTRVRCGFVSLRELACAGAVCQCCAVAELTVHLSAARDMSRDRVASRMTCAHAAVPRSGRPNPTFIHSSGRHLGRAVASRFLGPWRKSRDDFTSEKRDRFPPRNQDRLARNACFLIQTTACHTDPVPKSGTVFRPATCMASQTSESD